MLKSSAYRQAIGLAKLTYVAVDRIAADFRILEIFTTLLIVNVFLGASPLGQSLSLCVAAVLDLSLWGGASGAEIVHGVVPQA